MSYDPQVAVDAVFAAFGRDVHLLHWNRDVRAIVRAPDDRDRFGSRDILSTSRMVEIRRAEMEVIADGTVIVIDDVACAVRGTPEYRDPDRLIATVNTVPLEP